MSRCFPFPPPGYVVNGCHDEAMIESSSIKGEEEKSKKEHKRKERKRDKKEKKDKKDKKRERGEGESEKHSHKRRRKEEEEVVKDVQKNHRVDVFGKLKQSENSCLEKSSLTVERELVQSTSQNSCDSTLNSNEKEKQKVTLNGRHHNNNESTPNSNELRMEKEKQPIDGRHNNHSTELCKEKEKQLMDCRHNNNNNNNNNDSESIIRIRLPIRRPPKDPEVTNKDHQPCPSREIKLEQPKQHPCSTSEHASKPHEEEKRKKEHSSKSKHKEKKLSFATREALQFLNVVENWVPNRVELTNSGDEEPWWLMKKPSSHKIDQQQVNRNNETKEQVMSTTWPRARLLPEADVYALPYTVPF